MRRRAEAPRLDHLIFLPSGDAALTRRAGKYSTLSAVVLQWSRARKRYERQGLLVEEAALQRAEKATRLAQRFGVVTDAIVTTYAAAVRKPIQALATVGGTSMALLTDPILMGALVPPGVNPEEGVQAAWFLLAAWRW
jgi:hypothetical protein